MTAASTTAGTLYTPPNTSDPDYVAGVGVGATATSTAGGNGQIVITYSAPDNMTLVSPTVSVGAAPTYVDAYFLYKDDSGTAVLGTDITCELSRDDGTTWTAGTLTLMAAYDGTYSAIKARANVGAQPSGTSLKARIKTFNTKAQRTAAPALYAE